MSTESKLIASKSAGTTSTDFSNAVLVFDMTTKVPGAKLRAMTPDDVTFTGDQQSLRTLAAALRQQTGLVRVSIDGVELGHEPGMEVR